MSMDSRKKKSYLSLGAGTQFVDEDWLYREFEGFGMSKRAFRSFLAALKTPALHVGNSRLINLFQFRLALSAVSRLGRPDFLAPGCEAIRRCRAEGVQELESSYFVEEWENVLAELDEARKRFDPRAAAATREDLRAAAWTMAEAMQQLLPSKQQSDYDEENATKQPPNRKAREPAVVED